MHYKFDLLFTENPIQIMCDHYQLLLETMDPNEISKKMHSKKILSGDDLEILSFCFPIHHLKNSFILEHIRTFGVSKLFMFIEVLQGIKSQKHICETLLKGKIFVDTHTLSSRACCWPLCFRWINQKIL